MFEVKMRFLRGIVISISTVSGMSACGEKIAAGAVNDELIGIWTSGGLTTSAIYDPETDSWRNDGGSGAAYTFYADGTYEAARRARGLGTCAVVIKSWQRGTVSGTASPMTLIPSESVVRSENSCYGNPTDVKNAAKPTSYTWKSTGTTLTLTDASGSITTLTYK